jgi:cell fate regulator YaaT (PSP1 superfamily)
MDIVGIRFREAGKIYYFDPAGLDLVVGEWVVVETARGMELGRVVVAPGQVLLNELDEPVKPIVRLAWAEDIERYDELKGREREVTDFARRLSRERDLPMKVAGADFTLDGHRVTVSFTADERIDFRDLVREISRKFDVRVDMRQIGPRDQAKLADGYGICGRRLCCSSWLTAFPSISIKMARNQDLPLNPTKISGLCGRLHCCLSYEDEGYVAMRRELPRVGATVTTPTGSGKVIAVHPLKQTITLVTDQQVRVEVPQADLGTIVRWLPNRLEGDDARVGRQPLTSEGPMPVEEVVTASSETVHVDTTLVAEAVVPQAEEQHEAQSETRVGGQTPEQSEPQTSHSARRRRRGKRGKGHKK